MTTHTAPARDEQRATVRHLIAQGLSNRAIARQPGMPGKDAVRRLRNELAAAHRPSPAQTPPDEPPAPDDRATTPTGARHDAPPIAPTAPDTGATTDTGARHTGPPVEPDRADRITVPVDAGFRDDLAVLAQAGVDAPTGIRLAVQLLADAYRTAWDYDHYDRGTRPHVHVQVIGGRPFPTTRSTDS